jgi:hypothetical protein
VVLIEAAGGSSKEHRETNLKGKHIGMAKQIRTVKTATNKTRKDIS